MRSCPRKNCSFFIFIRDRNSCSSHECLTQLRLTVEMMEMMDKLCSFAEFCCFLIDFSCFDSCDSVYFVCGIIYAQVWDYGLSVHMLSFAVS